MARTGQWDRDLVQSHQTGKSMGRAGRWSDHSGQVHGISRDELEHGLPVVQIATCLETLIGGITVMKDAPANDAYWLKRLYRAAGREPVFALDDINTIAEYLEMAGLGRKPPAEAVLSRQA
jgi:hypothetical protein